MDIKQYFRENQKEFLGFVNSEYGRFLFGIKDPDPVVKVSPNSIHQLMDFSKDQAIIKGKFYCGQPIIAKILLPYLFSRPLKVNQVFPFNILLKNAEWAAKTIFPQVGLTTFGVGAGDGYVRNNNATYATSHDAADGNAFDYTGANTSFVAPGQGLSGGQYYIGRVFLPTDTSSITAAGTIVAGGNSVNVWPASIRNADSDTMRVVTTTQANTSQLANADFDQTGTTDNGSLALASFTGGQINTITLNATGDGNISKTGTTLFGLRSAQDIAGTPPIGDANDFGGGTGMSTSENATQGQRPYLTIIYTLPSVGGIIII